MIGWLDCSAGASGDMLLGALVDAGVPVATMQAAIDALGIDGLRLHVERTSRHGLASALVTVQAPATDDTTRDWADVRTLLARLPEPVRTAAEATFERLAIAEAGVHGADPDTVHFHEVGGHDALADVVGVCAGFAHLTLDELVVSPVAVGSGSARGAHGLLPVPVPAVLALLTGVPVFAGPVPHEACTPTGAALIATHATGYGQLPAMTPTTTGYGAGGRDPAEAPNLVRLVLGERHTDEQGAIVLETNVDDLDPRLWPAVVEELLAAGASDAWLSPIVMKKGRPAHTLHVLSGARHIDTIRQAIFAHTSTIGVRELRVAKHALDRRQSIVHIDGQIIRVKQAFSGGNLLNASVEFRDVSAAAIALRIPVKVALARAVAAATNAGLYP